MADSNLTPDETRRYARHIVLKGIGGAGQRRLKAARVLVVGAGGLGSPVIQYLAAAGVGALTLADGDRVSLSNLQRQTLHRTRDEGVFKVESAARFVADLNPHVLVTIHREMIRDSQEAAALCGAHDLVVEGVDRFAPRKLIAKACEDAGVPLVSGAVSMFDGQITCFAPHLASPDGRPYPRFADLYPETPDEESLPTCEQVGVIGALTGIIGSMMAMEAIKIITGAGTPLYGRLAIYDGRDTRLTEFNYSR